MIRNDWKGNGFMYLDAKVRRRQRRTHMIVNTLLLIISGFIKDQGRGN